MPIVDRRRPPTDVPMEAECSACGNIVRGRAINKRPYWDDDFFSGSRLTCTDGRDDPITGWECRTLALAMAEPRPPK